MPLDFEEALDHDARRFFDGLSYSKKHRIVLSVDGAKTAATYRQGDRRTAGGLILAMAEHATRENAEQDNGTV